MGSDYNPILLQKPQGEDETVQIGPYTPESTELYLVLQTKNQRLMLQQHGRNGFSIDSTHKTTKYGYLLYTGTVQYRKFLH